ncbi:MAG: TetR family transcriptional regulator [Thermodesulfobacteriota bacterium]|nr:MAG: TetR family transcriptional regulator [Thermodesulfobacteriota bacterium]
MGRPYEFDREETLSKAMDLFWEKGYKATSIDDLVDRMGIKRGSIYNTYGDKHSLFIAAVEYYAEEVTSKTIKVLESPGSPLENIKLFFETIVNTPPNRKTRGCLISNTVVELAPHDEKVAETVRIILEKIQTAFLNCLNRAVEVGELSKDTDTQALSHFLATNTHGLIVTGKSAVNNKQMKDVVNIILSTLN